MKLLFYDKIICSSAHDILYILNRMMLLLLRYQVLKWGCWANGKSMADLTIQPTLEILTKMTFEIITNFGVNCSLKCIAL